jgi:hypothetical protein
MTMQSEQHGHGWTNSLGAQLILTVVTIAAVVALAWYLVF